MLGNRRLLLVDTGGSGGRSLVATLTRPSQLTFLLQSEALGEGERVFIAAPPPTPVSLQPLHKLLQQQQLTNHEPAFF